MKKNSKKRTRYLLKRAEKEAKKNYRNRIFRKKRISHKPKLRSNKHLNRFSKKEKSDLLGTVNASPNFTILGDIKNVIRFIATLKKYAKDSNAGQIVFLDLSRINKIDIGAICMILSTVEELSHSSVLVKTNLPNDIECRNQLIEANFIPHLKRLEAIS